MLCMLTLLIKANIVSTKEQNVLSYSSPLYFLVFAGF